MKRHLLYGISICIGVILIHMRCTKEHVPVDEPTYDNAFCDSLEAAGIIDDYTFPILPGTPEWEQLNDEQRDSVLQIPKDTLAKMCTHGLIETCFNWPFLWHCMIYEHFDAWWYYIDHSFNGILTLSERSDAPEKMFKKYLEFDKYPYSDTITMFTTKKDIAAKLTFMELFFSREDILKEFSNKDKVSLGIKAKELWYTKVDYDTIEFSISPAYSCFLLGRMMYYDKYEPLVKEMSINKDLDDFIKIGSYIFYYNNSYEFIINNTDLYLSQLN